MAPRKMGSSVFHGGFSTFAAIFVLAPGKTYIFLVFFRAWFGIILFGMANGFLLLPVILSFVGPVTPVTDSASSGSSCCSDSETSKVTWTSAGTTRSSDECLSAKPKAIQYKSNQIVDGKVVEDADPADN